MKTLPPPDITPEIERRFWSLVRKGEGPDDCWEWTGPRWQNGYGCFEVSLPGQRRRYKAQRIVFLLMHGRFPSGYGCHTCDNPGCVRPDHVFDGTPLDNHNDMKRKGRAPTGERNGARTHPERLARGDRHPHRIDPSRVVRGEAHPWAKLTTDTVLAIRRAAAAGERFIDISRRLGASEYQVAHIVHRRSWAWLPDEQPSGVTAGLP